MYDKIIFFNHGHLGDSFILKHFIPEIKKILPSKSYAISNMYDYSYVYDVVDEHIPINNIGIGPDVWYNVSEDNKILYFNTWYGILQQPVFLEKIGINSELINSFRYDDGILYNWENYIFYLSLNLKLINENFSIFHMLEDKMKWVLPSIKTENVDVPFINDSATKVLIYNQMVTSGQSDNVDFTNYISDLLTNNTNLIVYTSQPLNLNKKFSNLIQLSDYIQYPDLIKICNISKKCDYICGPGNAPLISTWVYENLSNFYKTYIVVNRNNIGEAILFKESNCKNIVVKGTQELFEKLIIEINKK